MTRRPVPLSPPPPPAPRRCPALMGCVVVRKLAMMRHRNFTLGFMTAILLLGMWFLLVGYYMNVTVGRRDLDTGVVVVAPGLHALRLTWQPVVSDKNYVLSAFLDRRLEDVVVRVIAMQRMEEGAQLCLLWMPWRKEPVTTRASYKAVPENHNKDYWVCVYSCPVNDNTLPVAVSLVRDFTMSPTNIIPVFDASAGDSGVVVSRDFTLCVAVLHKGYNNFRELVESIELNRMFGVQKIIIYDYSIGHAVAKFLRYYIEEGVVDLIKWTLPVDQDEVHYYAQLAAINDCVYRTMYRTKFLMFSDLDEIIVPRLFSTWTKTMSFVMKPMDRHATWSGAFVLQNAFFPLDCEDQPRLRNITLVRRYQLRSLLKTIRISQMWPHLVRSKYILRPQAVTVAGVHYMWGFVGNFTHYNVSASVALMHHYRYYLNGCNSWNEDSFMWRKDLTLLKYRREITKRVWRTMAIVGDCPRSKSKPVDPRLPRRVL